MLRAQPSAWTRLTSMLSCSLPLQHPLRDACPTGWPACAIAAPRSTGWGNTLGWLQCVDKCSWILLALMPRDPQGSLLDGLE